MTREYLFSQNNGKFGYEDRNTSMKRGVLPLSKANTPHIWAKYPQRVIAISRKNVILALRLSACFNTKQTHLKFNLFLIQH